LGEVGAFQGPIYRDQYELIGVLQIGPTERLGETPARRGRRARSNVWRYPGATSLAASFPEPIRSRARLVPIRLVANAIKDCTGRNDVIFDPFCGAGATIMAAQQLSRRARCVEREPQLVDVAIRRWQAFTRREAFHAESGTTFEEIAVDRSQKEPWRKS
jgi:DNA modification methylase